MPEAKARAALPSAKMAAEIAEHFEREHRGMDTRPAEGDPAGEPAQDPSPRPLDPERDISSAGNPRPGAIFTYFFSEEEDERFHCALCGGTSLPKKIPYGTPERNAKVRREHPEIWKLAETIQPEDLAEATPEQLIAAQKRLEEITEDFDRGRYATALRGKVAKAKLQASKRESRDPRTAARIKNTSEWMLDAYAMLGTRQQVWDELDELRGANPELYRELIGDDREVSDSTKARWWEEEIEEEDRLAAKALYEARPEAERKREAAQRRVRKVRG